MSEIVEQVGGEYGATVRYKVHENGASVEFFAAKILSVGKAVDQDEFHPEYWQKGEDSYPHEGAQSFENAERYVEGFVKWDGCSHVCFGNEDAQLHLCGKSEFDKLATILAAIYARCGELMLEAGTELLDGEF
jgi:hypothetical protein